MPGRLSASAGVKTIANDQAQFDWRVRETDPFPGWGWDSNRVSHARVRSLAIEASPRRDLRCQPIAVARLGGFQEGIDA